MPKARLSEVTLNYEFEGEGPALVLINGLTMDLNGWANQIGEFKKHFRVLRYDCRGQGESDKPDMIYTHRLHAQDLSELMERLEIDRAHVLGLSNGGMIAQHLALHFRDKVGGLILVDTTSSMSHLLLAILSSWIRLIETGGINLMFDAYLPFLFGESFIKENADSILLMKELSIRRNSPQAVLNLIKGSLTLSLTNRLREIECPTLIIHGEEDILIPLRHAQVLCEGIPNARLEIIPQCGHVPPLEKPDEFNRLAIEFLKGIG